MVGTVDWPAWVQAVGSVGAIIAAIWIGRQSDKRARELVESERARQAKVAASYICHALASIRRDVLSIAEDVRKNMRTLESKKSHGPPRWLLKPDGYIVAMPPAHDRLIELALLLNSDAALRAVDALQSVSRHNKFVTFLEHEPASGDQEVLAVLAVLYKQLEVLQASLALASKFVQKEHKIQVILSDATHPPAELP